MLRVLLFLAWIPLVWQPLWGQTPRVRKHIAENPKQKPNLTGPQPQVGTEAAPLVVETHPRPESQQETAKAQADKDHAARVETWTLIFTGAATVFNGLLVIVGWRGVRAAIRTLRAVEGQLSQMERQANLMEEQITGAKKSSEASARDVRSSIAEAVRSADAMQGVAESMAANAASVKESVGISREIANMQKLATMLQSRAYLSAFFQTATFQDKDHFFEVKGMFRNHGNTPAYNVTFRAVARIIPMPISEDFDYPLPDDSVGPSVSFLAPGAEKIFTRRVPERVPDDNVDKIKRGEPPDVLAMWGIVTYRDAFDQVRRVRFAFTVGWILWLPGHDKDKDGRPIPPQIMSYDMPAHNDAD